MNIFCTDGHMFIAVTVRASVLRTFDDAERLENRGLALGLTLVTALALALALAFTLKVMTVSRVYTIGDIREH